MSGSPDRPELTDLGHWERCNAGPLASEPRLRLLHHLVNKHDPMELIAIGAPEDEYDSELFDIVRRLPECRSEDDTVKMIHCVFSDWFHPVEVPLEDCAALGRDAWALWHATPAQEQSKSSL